MDKKSLYKLSYGLYIISSHFQDKDSACVVNTLQQVTGNPPKLSVTINKDNFTQKIIDSSKLFTGVVLTVDADMNLIRRFGFSSSETFDKFRGFHFNRDENKIPYILDGTAARYSCKVTDCIDVGSHVLFVGEVLEGELTSNNEVMTYAYYHKVKNGITPPKSPLYQETQNNEAGWKCPYCGYIYKGSELPPGYKCPICGADGADFIKLSSE